MKKKIGSIIIILYVIIAIFVTICLLSYNQYKVSVFGDKTLIIIKEDYEDMPYKNGDLVIVGLTGYNKALPGEYVFFYKDNRINIAQIIEKKDFGDAGIAFNVEGDYQVQQEDIIGTSNNQTVIGKVGSILGFIESKWGFLFLIVFPSLLAFLREIFELIMEVKGNKKDE